MKWELIYSTTKCCGAVVEEPTEEELQLMGDNHPSLYGLANCPLCGECSEIESEYMETS